MIHTFKIQQFNYLYYAALLLKYIIQVVHFEIHNLEKWNP